MNEQRSYLPHNRFSLLLQNLHVADGQHIRRAETQTLEGQVPAAHRLLWGEHDLRAQGRPSRNVIENGVATECRLGLIFVLWMAASRFILS